MHIAISVAGRPRPTVRTPDSLRRGFTLFEAMLAVAFISVAGSVLLLGLTSALEATDAARQRTLAMGIAQLVMEEIAGCRYLEPGADLSTAPIGAEIGEASGANRTGFDDIDDYNGLSMQPPCDRFGIELGQQDGSGGLRHASFRAPATSLANWRCEVSVADVDAANMLTELPPGPASGYRSVVVSVVLDEPGADPLELARLRRVFAYVPTP